MVGIAGTPGSGKTTLAGRLAGTLARKAGRPLVAVVPMDGFHLTRAQLDGMPDPTLAHARRGAPWTFDAEAYVAALAELRTGGLGSQACPSFDHGVGDPVPGDIPVLPSHRIVVTEGNYLLLGATGCMHETAEHPSFAVRCACVRTCGGGRKGCRASGLFPHSCSRAAHPSPAHPPSTRRRRR